MLELFVTLLFVHYLFDFCLQSDFMSKYKGKLPFVMFVHVFVWTFAVCTTITYFTVLRWWVPLFLFVGHWMADSRKIKTIEKENLKDETNPDVLAQLKFLFHADQAWHVFQVFLVSLVG